MLQEIQHVPLSFIQKNTVLGTSFNVKAYRGKISEVTVATGKVHVEIRDQKSVEHTRSPFGNASYTLTRGQQAVYNPETKSLIQQKTDLKIYLAWKEKNLIFNEITLSKAIAMLERKFGVTINIQNTKLGQCEIIGEFNHQSLENILKALQFVLGFEYNYVSENQIEISGKGCNE